MSPNSFDGRGQGTQNFPAIIKPTDSNPEWLVVEMKKSATDVFEELQEGFNYLIDNKMARVK